MINVHAQFNQTFEFASPGCAWRPNIIGYMSMYGKASNVKKKKKKK